jgi:hypothetical protein
MPNSFKIILLSRSTTIYSLVLWLGLTLALVGADAGSALAKSVKPSKSTPAVDPSALEPLESFLGAEFEVGNAQTDAQTDAQTAASAAPIAQATPTPSSPPATVPPTAVPPTTAPTPPVARPTAPSDNQFVVPPGLTDREPMGEPLPVAPPATPNTPDPTPDAPQPPPTDPFGATGSTSSRDLGAPITTPVLRLQGAYVLQGDEDTFRVRAIGVYPLNDWLEVGAVVDATDDGDFNILEGAGVDLTELYVAAAPIRSLPNLRFVAGQIDFTSYFDRNSFAKDRTTHFFNSVFQSNPALQATTFTSRPGALLNWTVTDNIELKAAAFSSEPDLGDFAIDGFAGELGFRLQNFIIRGTYTSAIDGGTRTGFDEIFSLDRGDGRTGPLDGDREEAYGINAEYFFPDINLGLFGRYGHYTNLDLDGENTADTYSFGLNLLDLIMPDDRLGLGYGRQLSNSSLRDDETPDVIEIFYDARVLPNLRVGVTFQALNEFSESIAGFRIRTDFDLIPRRSL